MKTFARVISVVFMLLGLLILLIGVSMAISGLFHLKPETASPSPLMRILAGGAIGLQGLFLAAIGEVLWLLADIAAKTESTSEHMSALVRRFSQPKQS
jgi:uncharacterized membrane protein